ncbi:unnamed protein product [Prunus armeniaca]
MGIYIDASQLYNPRRWNEFELLGVAPPKTASPVITAPTLTLKSLPTHLRYAYLGTSETLPVIIAANLSETKEEKVLRLLQKHKTAIGWTIADIKGIGPSICMHRILMQEEHKPSIEHERQLNLNMKEVVHVEVLKLLDACIIYPICDSSWASPTQIVPKKEGMIVVKNENNELVVTRTVIG